MNRPPTFTRDQVLAGMPARRASTLSLAIEAKTARLAEQSRTAMATYLTPTAEHERERAFLAALADARRPVAVSVQDLERYAPVWAHLLPRDAETLASVAAVLLEKYPLRRADGPRIAEALQLHDPRVAAAFEQQRGFELGDAFAATLPLRQQLRWWRSRTAVRLESLSPTWTAFALTLSETVGAGVLALPIALAALGPVAAVFLLLVFGLVNVLTIAQLVEAITRSGTLRYGSAYLGRFVTEYLGRPGGLVVSVAILLLNGIGLGILILGFGTTMAEILGLSAGVWAAALAIAVALILRRDSLDATVASVFIVGGVNIVALLAMVVLAMGAFDADNFADMGAIASTPSGGLVGLVFGTVLMAFFGHTSAGNAAKVVLARDPGGRALLRGNVLAMLAALLLYTLVVVAFLGAVPAESLAGYPGTALPLLADAAGAGVIVIGAVFTILAMGLSSLHTSLGLYNQIGEWLPPVGSATTLARTFSTPRARAIAKAVPVVVILVLVEALLFGELGSFTASLGFLGTITLPLLAGLFPALLVVAARRRGGYVPARSIGPFGGPLVAAAVGLIFFVCLLAYAFVIWDDPVQRLAAALAAVAMAAVSLIALRDGDFRRRLVVELRAGPGRPAVARAGVVLGGERADVPLEWSVAGGTTTTAVDQADLGRADELVAVRVSVPEARHSSARVWVHQVDDTGASLPWPSGITIAQDGSRYPVGHDAMGVADVDGSLEGAVIEISPTSPGR